MTNKTVVNQHLNPYQHGAAGGSDSPVFGQRSLQRRVCAGSVSRRFCRTGKGIQDSATLAFVTAGLAIAFATPAQAGLSYAPGTFPEFMTWQDTPGPSWAVGVSNNLNGANDIHRQFQFGSVVPLDQSDSSAPRILHGRAEAALGVNRAWASVAAAAGAGSSVISLWKDSFVISQDADVTVQIHLEGTVPLIPAGVPLGYGASSVIYDFGIFRVADGTNMAEFYTIDGQTYQVALDGGVGVHGEDIHPYNQVRVGGPEIWNVTLKPFLTAGEYEFRSMLYGYAGTSGLVHSNLVDFSNGASFTGIAVPNGVTLSSTSGFLSEMSPGVYGYNVTAVPEPTSIALMLAGLFAVGSAVRAKRPVALTHRI